MKDEKVGLLNIEMLSKIPVEISVVLGKTNLTINSLINKVKGDFISLDHDSTDLVSIFANNKLIAKGEVVVNGTKLGVTIKEIVT
jgi:flagellar motor switch protein FliN/FliY